MDHNGNWAPAIFHRTGASDPSLSIREQMHTIDEAMREAGEEPVNDSVYFAKRDSMNLNYFENYLNIRIMPSLIKRSKLAESSETEACRIAFVWNLDEITMLSSKHMREISYLRPEIDSMSLHRLVNKVLLSLGISDPVEMKTTRVVSIVDPGPTAEENKEPMYQKYNALKKLYSEISSGVKKNTSIISHELFEKCGLIEEEEEICQTALKVQEIYHQRWKHVKKSLDLVKRRSANPKYKKYANVVISNEPIIYTLVQLILSGHSTSIKIDNIFSRCSPKVPIWEFIQRRFGEQCQLIYINSSNSHVFQKKIGVPVWKIEAIESLEFLYKAQRDQLLT